LRDTRSSRSSELLNNERTFAPTAEVKTNIAIAMNDNSNPLLIMPPQ
jgi:hypothetical protein